MNKTGISWTDYTWNPVTGCTKVSEGCKFCYAEAWSKRWGRSFEPTFHEEKLKQTRTIPAGSKVFVNSMSDLFHEKISFADINAVFNEIRNRGDVIFQILTKRPERALEYTQKYHNIPINAWMGVSVESGKYNYRIDILREIPAVYRFVSFEPLIGPVAPVNLAKVNWIIIGGESGPHHRPMDTEWARSLVKEAKKQNVAVWMKQLGGLYPGGNLEDFPEDLRIREFPDGVTRVVK
ncbi:MAG: DUF5131 family protein [Thermoplasmatales archaeon]